MSDLSREDMADKIAPPEPAGTLAQLVAFDRLDAQAAALADMARSIAGRPARDFQMAFLQRRIREGGARELVGGPPR